MARGDSLARQLSLIQMLDERRELVVAEVAQELGSTQRTVYRDLAVLERVGVPIYQERRGGRARWRVVETYRRRLALTLTFSEILALAAGRDLLAGTTGTLFHESAISALEKIRAALPTEIAKRAMAAAQHLSAATGGAHDYRRSSEVVQQLVAAVERRETVELLYRKPGERQYSRRVVDPYHLHVQAGALYLFGFCHQRQETRTFLVDRAGEVRPTGKAFEERMPFTPTKLLQGSFGPWSGKPERIRLRFASKVADFVVERRVHPSQTNQWRDDGSLDVDLHLPVGPAVVAWLLGWGAQVTIVAPKRLGQRVAREHLRAAKTK
jgi:proteasome accessory factor B